MEDQKLKQQQKDEVEKYQEEDEKVVQTAKRRREELYEQYIDEKIVPWEEHQHQVDTINLQASHNKSKVTNRDNYTNNRLKYNRKRVWLSF